MFKRLLLLFTLFSAVSGSAGSSTNCVAGNVLSPVPLDTCTHSGCLDGGFGGATAPAPAVSESNAVVEGPDGSLFGAGIYRDPNFLRHYRISKLTPLGVPDVSFGGTGTVDLDAGGDGYAYSIALQASADPMSPYVLAAGNYRSGTGYISAVARLNPDGTLDQTFGTNGWALIPSVRRNTDGMARSILVDAAGKIIVAINYGSVVRLSRDGKTIEWTRPLSATSLNLAFQTVGTTQRIVTVGANSNDFVSYRLNNDATGTIDTSYGASGVATVSFCGSGDLGYAVSVDAAQRVLLGGWTIPSSSTNRGLALARLTPDGKLDTTFGDVVAGKPTGKFTADVSTKLDDVVAVIPDSSGRIFAFANATPVNQPTSAAVFRLNSDGTLDKTFGGTSSGGIVVYPRFPSTNNGFISPSTGYLYLTSFARVIP